MLLLFKKYLKSRSIADQWENLEAIMTQRARNLVRHAVNGLGISYKRALELMDASPEDLTEYERNIRTSLLAAFDNLADFAVVQEYQMADELPEWNDEFADEDEEDEDEMEGFVKVFKKYNHRYARVENLDVMYAMIIAARYAKFHEGTMLIYMTQGDERVRPWHLDWEGFEAPKESFPEWLIPPIEVACRCFLVEDSTFGEVEIYDKASTDVQAAVAQPQMPFWFDRTFKESVAKGGRIFSDEHPYFQVDAMNVERLREISERIKQKLMNNAED